MTFLNNRGTLLSSAAALSGEEFRNLQRRAFGDAKSMQSAVDARASSFSLRQLINSRCEWQMFPVDSAALEAVRSLHDACSDQSGGESAWGTWVPLTALIGSRDLTTANASALLTTKISPSLQNSLAPASAVMGGATILSGLNGNGFSLPAIDVPFDVSSAWIGENDAGLVLDATTRVATLVPKTLGFSFYVSRRLMMNSKADLESALRSVILKGTLQAIDQAALRGHDANAPAGILNDPDLQVLIAGANGAAPNWDQLAELEYQVGTRAGNMAAPAFLSSPKLRKKYRKTQKGVGLDFILGDGAQSLMGHPLRVSGMVPDNLDQGTSAGVCTPLIFGDWAEVVVGFWGPQAVDILVDPITKVKDGLIKISVRAEVGVAVRDIRAFAAYKDLLAA